MRGTRTLIQVACVLGLLLAAGACSDSETEEPGDPPIDWDEFYAPSDLPDDGKRRVTIVHTNDLHSYFNGTGPISDYNPRRLFSDETRGGLARIAALVERERRRARPGQEVLALDGGDYSMGTAFSALSVSHGAELQLLDAMGFTATTIGNHEFDFGPANLARSLVNGLEGASSLHVLASNLVFDPDDPGDDDLAALMGDLVHEWVVVELDNGLKVGIFGLLGQGAYQLAPSAPPVTVRSPVEAAREMVELLREQENVDLVFCVSHSGVDMGSLPGEDETIAKNVDGLDVIVSGHSHTLLEEPLQIGDTLVVQVGAYGEHVGRLTLVEEDGAMVLEDYEAMPVDSSIPGEPTILEFIDGYEAALDAALFEGLGISYREPVAVTAFDIPRVRFAEAPIGNLVTDGILASVRRALPDAQVDIAIEANGVLRAGLLSGATGRILMADLLHVLPLGTGPDGLLGYPMLLVYLTAAELKTTAEIAAGFAPSLGADSFYLQVAGMRFDYREDANLFRKVQAIYLGTETEGYDETPLDTSAENTRLYGVAVNLYIGQMLSVLESMLPALSIVPKDADGNPIEDLTDALVDLAPGATQVEELKLWQTLLELLQHFPIDEEEGLPRVPERYSAPQGRAAAIPAE